MTGTDTPGRDCPHNPRLGAIHDVSKRLDLADSYHCSRYNTNTGRLTPEMFRAVFGEIRTRLT